MQMTWWSSLNRERNCKRSWSAGSLACKRRNFGQHGKNQGPDIWAVTSCAYRVQQRPLWREYVGCRHNMRLLCRFFQLGPEEIQWYLWHSESHITCKLARPMGEFIVGGKRLGVVPSFYKLWDWLSSGGGCELTSITRCRIVEGRFKRNISSCYIPF